MSAVRRGLAGQLWVEARTVYLALIVGGCAGSMGTLAHYFVKREARVVRQTKLVWRTTKAD